LASEKSTPSQNTFPDLDAVAGSVLNKAISVVAPVFIEPLRQMKAAPWIFMLWELFANEAFTLFQSTVPVPSKIDEEIDAVVTAIVQLSIRQNRLVMAN
jgi:hypothetical protein